MLVSNLFYLSTSHFEKYGEITDLYMPKVCSLSLSLSHTHTHTNLYCNDCSGCNQQDVIDVSVL